MTSTFAILPAIDLRDGRVVRLSQGDFSREQVYADDPPAVARAFAETGVRWIHVVDLDGARSGGRRQAGTVGAIVAASRLAGLQVEVAGGIRTGEAIAEAIAGGASRVVLGTAALTDPALVGVALERHGADRIVVALDVRDGRAFGDGWAPGALGVPAVDALIRLGDIGVATFAVTAIDRDGLLGGPDLALLEACVRATTSGVIASGGIRSIADLRAVRDVGCSGAIVGRAIYDGRLDLAAALAVMDETGD